MPDAENGRLGLDDHDDEMSSLRSLYAQVASRALALAVRIVGRQDEAEDVVQDAFMEACRTRDRYDAERGSRAAWLLNIARSRALDWLRKDGNRKRFERDAANERPAAFSAHDPAARTELERKLGQLPDRERQLLLLSYVDGFTQSEIARHTGLPLGTVKTCVRRGLARLFTLLEG